MIHHIKLRSLTCAILLSLMVSIPAAASDPVRLPTGLVITPDAAPGSVLMALNPGMPGRRDVTLGQAVTTALSPDGSTLLVLTSGYNKEEQQRFDEYVFAFDVRVFPPRQLQAMPVPNTFCGLVWNPNGAEFYVSGGVDDRMYVFTKSASGRFARAAAIALGHPRGNGLLSNAPAPANSSAPRPMTAGIGVNGSGTVAVVANFYNDSISVIDLKSRKKTAELDLRPGIQDKAKTGVPGGEYPYWIAVRGNDKAYISSPRDREIVVVRLGETPSIAQRIALHGQPNRLLLNRKQDRLFVAMDNSDSVGVIDTEADRVIADFGVAATPSLLQGGHFPKGANPNSLALSPDERTLYVTNGGTNAVVVVAVDASGAGTVAGMIPTGWYPNSVSVSLDGRYLHIVNGKSVPGPNPGNCRGDAKAPDIPDCSRTPNQYVYSLEKSSLLSLPVPQAPELDALTKRVIDNNHLDRVGSAADPVIEELRRHIQHVIYIIKENRSYDQILGDLEVGDGDPSLTEFPEPVTPNHHSLARKFVTIDNFLDSGEVSGVGWDWTTAARTTDYTEKTVPPNYAGRGFSYDWEGTNRNVNVGFGSLSDRLKAQPLLSPSPDIPADPNVLPGESDVAAPDALSGEAGTGYLWDEILRAGRTLRNYGIFCDVSIYNSPPNSPGYTPISRDPFNEGIPQAIPTKKALMNNTDLYFRGFDQDQADFYLYREWEREFDQFVANRNLPNLSLVRLAHDHFGSFGTALYGINTPALQMSDNDYAVGLLVEKVANSPYKSDTLIFVVEDDAQDGPDHVDAHRSLAYIVGPYVKQGAVISERYTTVNMVRTIESLFGIAPSSLYSAVAPPMSEVFDLKQSEWSYDALVPALLRSTQLPLPAAAAGAESVRDRHNAAYWQKRLGDMDYDEEDKLDTPRFNRELWKGIMGSRPYPRVRSGENLRKNRAELLRRWSHRGRSPK